MIDNFLNRILQGDCLELFKNIPIIEEKDKF